MQTQGIRRRLAGALIGIGSTAVVLSGCGGGGGGGAANSGPASTVTLEEATAEPLGQEVTCPGLQFSARQGVPGDTITFQGLPGSMGTVSIRVVAETDDGQQVVPLFVHSGTKSGSDAFTVPLHPSTDPEGGEIKLEIGDGNEHCPTVAFDIEPLPSAPADYTKQLQSDIEQWVDGTIRALGYRPANLTSTDPANLSPTQRGLRVAKIFASSSREDALPALAEKASNDGDDTLERLLTAYGLEAELTRAISELPSVPTGNVQITSATQPSRMYTRGFAKRLADQQGATSATQSAAVTTAVDLSDDECTSPITDRSLKQDPDKVAVANAAELSKRMQAASKGRVFDAGGQLSRALGATGLTLDALSAPDEAGELVGWTGTGVFVLSTVSRARLALEPQTIESFDLLVAETQWVEDRPAADTAFWDKAQVIAEGDTFNLAKRNAQAVVTALGLVPGPIGTTTTAATTFAPDEVSRVIDDLTEGSCIRVKAPRYGPINVDDPRWTTSRIEGTTFVQDTHTTYHGVDIGMSTLKVELRSAKFAENDFFVEERPLQSNELVVSLIPAAVTATQPGETVTIEATARNAHSDPADFDVTVPSGNGSIVAQSKSDGRISVDVQTSPNRGDFPIDVRFEARQPTLPRGTSRRVDTATIELGGEVTIAPRTACLKPNQSLNVSATVEGFQAGNDSVSWSATSGGFTGVGSQSATYTAPNGTGTVDVTATADADNSVSDTVRYTLSDNCFRKEWNNTAIKAVDGDGTYSPNAPPKEPDDLCPADDHDPTQEQSVQAATRSPATIPPTDALWFDRSETLDAALGHNSRRYVIDEKGTSDPADDSCSRILLSASNNSEIRYVGEGDGTLSLTADIDLDSTCSKHDNGEIDCALASDIANAGGGAYYLRIDSSRQYRLTGELECSSLNGDIQMRPFTVTARRFATPGDATSVTRPGVNNPDGSSIPTGKLVEEVCSQPDQTIGIDVPFNLEAPASGDDLIVLRLGGTIEANAVPVQAKTGYTQPTNPPTRLPNVGPDSFTTDGVVDFSVRLRPR